MKKKLTIPYRPWHTDKVEPYVYDLAKRLAKDGMIGGLLGPDFKVLVKFDAQAKRITYSFRTADYVEPDESEQDKG
jgi:hypothetical protein